MNIINTKDLYFKSAEHHRYLSDNGLNTLDKQLLRETYPVFPHIVVFSSMPNNFKIKTHIRKVANDGVYYLIPIVDYLFDYDDFGERWEKKIYEFLGRCYVVIADYSIEKSNSLHVCIKDENTETESQRLGAITDIIINKLYND
jgi:hypothetical protein